MTVGYSHRNFVPHGLTPYGRVTTAVRKKQRRKTIVDRIRKVLRRDQQ